MVSSIKRRRITLRQTRVQISVTPSPAAENAFCQEKIVIAVLGGAAYDSGVLFLCG